MIDHHGHRRRRRGTSAIPCDPGDAGIAFEISTEVLRLRRRFPSLAAVLDFDTDQFYEKRAPGRLREPEQERLRILPTPGLPFGLKLVGNPVDLQGEG